MEVSAAETKPPLQIPPPVREAFAAATFVLSMLAPVTLAVIGSLSRFSSSELGNVVVIVAALASTALVCIYVWNANNSNRRNVEERRSPSIGMITFNSIRTAMLSLLVFWVFIYDLTAIACWYTDLFGQPSSQIVTVLGFHPEKRYSCSRLAASEEHLVQGHRVFCGPLKAVQRIPRGTKITLFGRQSALGMDVDPIDFAHLETVDVAH